MAGRPQPTGGLATPVLHVAGPTHTPETIHTDDKLFSISCRNRCWILIVGGAGIRYGTIHRLCSPAHYSRGPVGLEGESVGVGWIMAVVIHCNPWIHYLNLKTDAVHFQRRCLIRIDHRSSTRIWMFARIFPLGKIYILVQDNSYDNSLVWLD